MKTNSLLTYLLYALLATLIIAAGFKACQMQKEKQLKAQEEAEWEETHRKLHPETDSINDGSSYVSRDSSEQTTTGTKPSAPQKKGIEDEPGKKATTSTTPTTTKPKTSTTKGSSAAAKGAGSGRWVVRAGTFSQMDNARDQLEKVIKMGYTNAEISKTSSGKAAVIVLRTNDKAKAINTADQLERRGLDAAVFDRNKKD